MTLDLHEDGLILCENGAGLRSHPDSLSDPNGGSESSSGHKTIY